MAHLTGSLAVLLGYEDPAIHQYACDFGDRRVPFLLMSPVLATSTERCWTVPANAEGDML